MTIGSPERAEFPPSRGEPHRMGLRSRTCLTSNSSLCPLWLIKGKPGSSQKRVVPAVRLEPPTHIDCVNSNSLLQGRCYAVLENACSSGIVQRNASARSRNTRIPYSPCASRIILNMLAKPNCSSVATITARRE
jgi:hypothetical protein